jgi:hypothetical protein
MKILKDPKHPLSLFMVAESEADRILVALLRKTKRVIFHKGASEEGFAKARELSLVPEGGERVARRMMDEDPQCKLHPDSSKRGCPDCLGLVAFSIGTMLPFESSPPHEETLPDDGPFGANSTEDFSL